MTLPDFIHRALAALKSPSLAHPPLRRPGALADAQYEALRSTKPLASHQPKLSAEEQSRRDRTHLEVQVRLRTDGLRVMKKAISCLYPSDQAVVGSPSSSRPNAPHPHAAPDADGGSARHAVPRRIQAVAHHLRAPALGGRGQGQNPLSCQNQISSQENPSSGSP